MPTYFHNPENALKRANEFCELGKHNEALECLFDALKNRKFRILKQTHESIINKFLELCVELKKSQMAKDGLYCYRNLCLGVNIKSWEDSIRNYLQLAESKVEDAQEAYECLILDVDDLDQDVTPETLLKAVSSEGPQERTERVTLLPWVKFLWECHRNCLDLLRNIQTEKLYHVVAQNAFKFCVKFSRRSELRKLFNILKVHSMQMQKRHSYLKTDDIEIQHRYLETAFVELESAITMDLWQDAFKVLEDIHSVIGVSKKLQHSKIVAHYYDKISCAFWKGEEYLFHAASVLRFFILVKDQKKNLSSEDVTKLATRVLLSVLAIPLPPVSPMIDLVTETDSTVTGKKNRLLASLLDLSKCPTRASLMKDVIHVEILQHVPEELQDLFQVMENDVEPSKVFSYVSAAGDCIKQSGWDLEQYLPFLHKTAAVKILLQLSKLYTSIKISTLKKFTGFSNPCYLEKVLVDSARRYELPLRIDHLNECVHFTDKFDIFLRDSMWNESEAKTSDPDSYLKCLTFTYSTLKRAVNLICPECSKNENKLIVEKIARRYIRERDVYRKNLLHRKGVIEKYKEHMENMRIEREKDEKKQLAEKLSQYEAAEKERLQREAEERNLQRLQREQEELKRKILIEKMETLKKTTLGSQIIENIGYEDLDDLDPQILFSKQIEQLNRERKELFSRLRRQEKSLNHLERAKRVEEIPLLIKEYDEKKKTDVEMWNEFERHRIETAWKERARAMQKKKRVLEIKEDLNNFLELIWKRQSDAYARQIEEFSKTIGDARIKRLKERAENRKQRRREDWTKQQELRKLKEAEEVCRRDSSVDSFIKTGNNFISSKVNILDECANFATPVQKLDAERNSYPSPEFHNNETTRPDIIKSSYVPSNSSFQTYRHRDTYYSNKVYKSRNQGTERNEKAKYDKDSEIENYRSQHYQRIRSSIYEQSAEISLSWRKSSTSYKEFTLTNHRVNKEDYTSRPTMTIMKRTDSTSEVPTNIHDREVAGSNSKKSTKPSERKSDTPHSCTPWAKLKRLLHDK